MSENPFANLNEETQRQIQEMQILEHNFQQLLMQKQMFQNESNEAVFAIEELEKSEGEVFKIVAGQIVIKSTKEKLEKELKHRKELLEMRLKTMEKQEKEFSEKLEAMRQDILDKISPKSDEKKRKNKEE